MKGAKTNKLLLAGGTVLTAGWLITGWAGLLTAATAWPVGFGVLGAGLFLTAVCLWQILRGHRQDYLAAQRHLDALCRTDLRDLSAGNTPEVPPLAADNPWAPLADRIRQALEEHGRQFDDVEQRRAAAEIRSTRAATQAEQIRAILAGLNEPLMAVDPYGQLLLANRSAEQLFQFDSEKTEDRALASLVHSQKLLDLLTATAQRKSAGNRADEIEIAGPDGTPRCYRVTAARLPGGQPNEIGASAGTVAVLRDIGDQKALQKRNAEFVSAVSHEMKAPLAGIKAYLELLVDGDAEDEETREEFLGVIESQADRLQRLVENLLNLARIEAGVVKVSKQARALNPLLEEALRVVQPSAEAKQIELISDLSPMYLGVLSDHDMLLQAAINLLSNAVKYTPSGGRVTLRSRLDDDQVRFDVQDTGVGLSEEDCRRVFEKFYRVNKSKDMAGGTGLGLPLAKHIVEDVHGGRLWVESVPGQGSTFSVALPSAGQMNRE